MACGVYGLYADAVAVAGRCFIGEVGNKEGDGGGAAAVALDGGEEFGDGVECDLACAFADQGKHG